MHSQQKIPRAFVLGMILLPVLICLIGVGAFLHIAVAVVGEEEQDKANLGRQLGELDERRQELERQLSQVKPRLAELGHGLTQERENAEAAQKLTEELRRLLAEKSKLDAERADLAARLAAATTSRDQAEQRAGQTREKVQQAQRRVAQLETDLAGAKPSRPGPQPAPSGGPEPNTSVRDWESRFAQRRAALEASKTESQRLAAQLAQIQRELTAPERTVHVTGFRGTQEWNAPEPLYVECEGAGVKVQPSGTRFAASPSPEQRDAFLQTVRQTGYVLFLIRPDGFESFKQYRKIVASREPNSDKPTEYGYEPVNAEWRMVYPEKKR
jgi:regulator of replication initiation timing